MVGHVIRWLIVDGKDIVLDANKGERLIPKAKNDNSERGGNKDLQSLY